MTQVMSRIGSGRFATMVLAFMMLSLLLVGIDRDTLTEDALALTSRGPIIIEGNSQLASHPALRGGSGTSGDPYIFSDYLIDTTSSKGGAIAVRNTSMPYIFRNITIYTSSPATAISIHALNSGGWQPIQGAFINVTVIGSGRHMHLHVANYFTVKDCTFVNTDPSGDLIYTNWAWETAFLYNTFNAPDMKLNLYYAYYFRFRGNTGSIGDYYQNYYRYTDIANNTLTLKNMDLYSGLSSDLQGNSLTSNASGSALVRLTDCNRIKVANNTFTGGESALYISHPNTYSPPYNNYPRTSSIAIKFNTIRSSYTGLKFYWTTGHPSITYFSIHDNDFLNCTSFAVDLYSSGGSKTTEIFRNRFIGNAGATSGYNPGIKQARDYYFQLSWSNSQMGNHWGDWTGPDDDSDGFVDSPYPLSGWSNPKDNMPVSNPYFDFDPPEFTIITPTGQFLEGSYLNFTWEANDPGSGIKKVRIRDGFNDWVDVIGRDHHAMMISEGQHFFRLKAIDNANLTTLVEMTLNLNRSKSPVRLLDPLPSSYLDSGSVKVRWKMDPWFVPRQANIRIDLGAQIDLDPYKDFTTSLPDGPHRIDLSFQDHYGIEIVQRADFNVDTVPPQLQMLYPSNGAVLSNNLVHFRWEAVDVSPELITTVSLDSGTPVPIEGGTYSKLIASGVHTFEVSVEDLAGHRTPRSISFSISKNTSLSITSPILSRPTKELVHTMRWEYLSHFEVAKIVITISGTPSFEIDRNAMEHVLTFSEGGRHIIKVEAEDPAGNTISDEVELIIDVEPPRPGFIGISDPFITNSTNILLRWGAVESWGIDHYELYVDGVKVGKNIVADRYTITLEEGGHEVRLVAYDRAGNSGSSTISMIVDRTPPLVEISSPQSRVISTGEIELIFTSSDINGIVGMNITIDNSLGKRYIETDLVSSFRVKVVEGANRITVKAYDPAGNAGSAFVEYLVDLHPPSVQLQHEREVHTRDQRFLLRWSASDSQGIAGTNLTVGEQRIPLVPELREWMLNLDEGLYLVTIEVSDLAGRIDSDSITINVDMTPPLVGKTGDPLIEGSSVILTWYVNETTTLTYELKFDNDTLHGVSFDLGQHELKDVPPGDHVAVLIAIDPAGNIIEIVWEFTVKGEDPRPVTEGGMSPVLIAALLLVILAAVAAAVAFFLIRRRPREEEKKVRGPTRPQTLKLSHVAPVVAAAPARPPPAREHTPVTEDGSRYIRPEKAPPQRKDAVRSGPVVRPNASVPQRNERSRTDTPPKVKEEIPIWDEDDVEWDEIPEWEDA